MNPWDVLNVDAREEVRDSRMRQTMVDMKADVLSGLAFRRGRRLRLVMRDSCPSDPRGDGDKENRQGISRGQVRGRGVLTPEKFLPLSRDDCRGRRTA